jgi:nucleotide-binding universal stress UspA family protein
MIKTILVPVTGSAVDNAAFAAAVAVARPLSAHINFLHVRIDSAAVAVTMASEGGGSTMVGGLVERLDAEADKREKEARQSFDRFCVQEGLAVAETPLGPAGPSAQWLREIGAEPFWISEHGRAADLLVIGQPSDGDGVSPETIETALLDSGRPILVPPARAITALPETIVVAWKATREAAHAVTAASPLLSLAKRVRILTVAEAENLPSEEGSQLALNLRWRGISASSERLEPDERSPAARLLAAAAESQALLVMGGYGHSRLRQWIFGGFTRHVLQTPAAVPILIAH